MLFHNWLSYKFFFNLCVLISFLFYSVFYSKESLSSFFILLFDKFILKYHYLAGQTSYFGIIRENRINLIYFHQFFIKKSNSKKDVSKQVCNSIYPIYIKFFISTFGIIILNVFLFSNNLFPLVMLPWYLIIYTIAIKTIWSTPFNLILKK